MPRACSSWPPSPDLWQSSAAVCGWRSTASCRGNVRLTWAGHDTTRWRVGNSGVRTADSAQAAPPAPRHFSSHSREDVARSGRVVVSHKPRCAAPPMPRSSWPSGVIQTMRASTKRRPRAAGVSAGIRATASAGRSSTTAAPPTSRADAPRGSPGVHPLTRGRLPDDSGVAGAARRRATGRLRAGSGSGWRSSSAGRRLSCRGERVRRPADRVMS